MKDNQLTEQQQKLFDLVKKQQIEQIERTFEKRKAEVIRFAEDNACLDEHGNVLYMPSLLWV